MSQLREHPHLSRNGSIEVVLKQIPTPQEAHRVNASETTEKTKSKIHSQIVQSCKHPNLGGNSSTQAILIQIPTVKEMSQTLTDDKMQNSLTERSKM